MDVVGQKVFVDVFGDHVVGLDQLSDLCLKGVFFGFAAVNGNSNDHAEPFGQLFRVGENEHVPVASRNSPAILYLVYLVAGSNAPNC